MSHTQLTEEEKRLLVLDALIYGVLSINPTEAPHEGFKPAQEYADAKLEVSSSPLTPANYDRLRKDMWIHIPSSEKEVRLLRQDANMDFYTAINEKILAHNLHENVDYLFAEAKTPHREGGKTQYKLDHYLLAINKGAYQTMAIDALMELADPATGRDLASLTDADAYKRALQDETSPLAQLIASIMRHARLSDSQVQRLQQMASDEEWSNNIEFSILIGKIHHTLKAHQAPSHVDRLKDAAKNTRNPGDGRVSGGL